MKKKLRVGFDFDGVIAYNPLRIARMPVTIFKRKILGQKKTTFFTPRSPFEKWLWELFHDSSFIAAPGTLLLKQLVTEKKIEAYLISGRFGYLDQHLYRFLDRTNLRGLFKEIHLNKKDEQPHLFKERLITALGLDFYVEDNWDIVEHLHGRKLGKTRVYWVSNILDQFIDYPYKHPSLSSVLRELNQP